MFSVRLSSEFAAKRGKKVGKTCRPVMFETRHRAQQKINEGPAEYKYGYAEEVTRITRLDIKLPGGIQEDC